MHENVSLIKFAKFIALGFISFDTDLIKQSFMSFIEFEFFDVDHVFITTRLC